MLHHPDALYGLHENQPEAWFRAWKKPVASQRWHNPYCNGQCYTYHNRVLPQHCDMGKDPVDFWSWAIPNDHCYIAVGGPG